MMRYNPLHNLRNKHFDKPYRSYRIYFLFYSCQSNH